MFLFEKAFSGGDRYDYEFNVAIWADSPWSNEMELELSGSSGKF